MSGFTMLGTTRLDAQPRCEACGAGATISFNWRYAQERRSPEDLKQISLFSLWKVLRVGSLYRCHVCNEVWHLDGGGERMTHVAPERLDLVLAWDRAAIELPEALQAVLREIGPTPPDVYGNGAERRVTPCTVETVSGERFEKAMVCIQRNAPVQDHMTFRLGSEIAQISESPFALPVAVREVSSRAEEMRMGFSPTLIEMPDGRRFVMNGMTSFMVMAGYDAREASVAEGSFFREEPPPSFVERPTDLVYFIVDGEPGWVRAEPNYVPPIRKRRGWFRNLLGR